MEETLQRVFSLLISVIILFLLPMYIAFEKKDDISYNLALKVTNEFVNTVNSRGYLSRDMYDKYVKDLSATGNDYAIQLEHIAKKYYPEVLNKGASNQRLSYRLSEERYTEKQILQILDNEVKTIFKNLTIAEYRNYTYDTIPAFPDMYGQTVINSNGSQRVNAIYTMSIGDEFSVIIKNTNTSIASVFFNALTLGANTDNGTRVYINYGGTVLNELYKEL